MQPRNRRKPKYGFWSWDIPTAIALAGMTATVAIVAPARAATINTWAFDEATRELTVTLPSGVTPDYFLLAQPARIVLTLPNTTLGAVQSERQYGGAIRNIRLSETADGARIVIEFAPNTLLDPRHAELTAQALGNGQTEWTLRPLLQGDATGTIAATPPPAPSSQAPTASSPPPAQASSPPAAQPPAAAEPPAATDNPAEEPSPPVPSLDSPPQPDTAPTLPDEEDTATEPGEDAIADTAAAAAAPPEIPDAPPVEIPVAPATPAAPAAPSLPDIAGAATTGAVRALPTTPDPFRGVSTDASELVADEPSDLDALPPGQIPIDPFVDSSQASVSVPSLEESDRTPAPSVSVPAIADAPDAPPTSPSDQSSTSPALPPNQVRPPGSEPATAAPPPPATTTPPITTPPPVAQTPTEVVAATSIEIPTIPAPPDSWYPQPDDAIADNEIRPPRAIAQSPAETEDIAPTEMPTIEVEPVSAMPPPPAPVAVTDDPSASLPAPTDNDEGLPPPPFLAAPGNEAPGASSITPPPPLPATSAPDSVRQEVPTIPPPPTVIREDGTVPFGMPLPQSKAYEGSSSPQSLSRLNSLPVGTRMTLQYTGTEPLVLETPDPVYEVLTVAGNVHGPGGQLLVPSGAQVLGRFEGLHSSGRRFVAQTITIDRDRLPLLAESDWIVGTADPDGVDVAITSSIGAAAITLLAGFSGLGLLGGAAAGAAVGYVSSPTLVVIEPGDLIHIEVVSDILPFNDAPDITRQYRNAPDITRQ